MTMSTTNSLPTDRTSEDVDHDLDAWGREMEVVLAEVNLASANMRQCDRGTTRFVDAESAYRDALRRLGELDRRREELQAEARARRAPGDNSPSPSASVRGTTTKVMPKTVQIQPRETFGVTSPVQIPEPSTPRLLRTQENAGVAKFIEQMNTEHGKRHIPTAEENAPISKFVEQLNAKPKT
jgi:hypothetical protein